MKTLSIALACMALAASLQAQVFRPAAVSGAALGAVAGAVIGNNSGSHNAWKGAAIGAGAGLLIGAAVDESRHQHRVVGHGYSAAPVRHPVYVARHSPWGYHHTAWRPSYGWHRPYYSGYWAPYYSVSYPVYDDYVWPSTVLGGIAGAIIGHNSGHHNAWRGAAIGAGAGMLIGSIAEGAARDREAVAAERAWASRPVVEQSAPTQNAPQNVTIINNYYNQTPMSSANAMFGRQ